MSAYMEIMFPVEKNDRFFLSLFAVIKLVQKLTLSPVRGYTYNLEKKNIPCPRGGYNEDLHKGNGN